MSYKKAKSLIKDLERAKVAISKVLLHKLKPYHKFDIDRIFLSLNKVSDSIINQYNSENGNT